MTAKDLVTYLLAALTIGGSILGVGRYVGRLEDRIDHLEQRDTYEHGSYLLPKETH